MDIILKIHHILASGCNKRFMIFYLDDGNSYCVRISDKMYDHLKSIGVITAQKLRYLK